MSGGFTEIKSCVNVLEYYKINILMGAFKILTPLAKPGVLKKGGGLYLPQNRPILYILLKTPSKK